MNGKRLKTLKQKLLEKEITHRKASNLANIPEVRFSHIITGRLNIRKEEREALCALLNMKDEELFKELYDEEENE